MPAFNDIEREFYATYLATPFATIQDMKLAFMQQMLLSSVYTDRFEVFANGDVEIKTAAAGLILKSPNGTRYKITVDDLGVLSTAVA